MKIEVPEAEPDVLEYTLKEMMADMLLDMNDEGRNRMYSTSRERYNTLARTLHSLVSRHGYGYICLLDIPVKGGGRLSDRIGVVDEECGSVARGYGQT